MQFSTIHSNKTLKNLRRFGSKKGNLRRKRRKNKPAVYIICEVVRKFGFFTLN